MDKPKGGKSSKIALAERVDLAEELLLLGLGAGHVERQLAKEHKVSTRQARRYIHMVYERWQEQTAEDAPHRREKVIRMAERFYAKAMAAKDFRAAAQGLAILSRLSGAMKQHDPERDQYLAEIGPPPKDPTKVLLYAQKIMAFALWNVSRNQTLDPERWLRWVTELGSKLGMIYPRSLVEDKVAKLEAHAGVGDEAAHVEDDQRSDRST